MGQPSSASISLAEGTPNSEQRMDTRLITGYDQRVGCERCNVRCNVRPWCDDDMTMLDFTPTAWGKNRNDRGKLTFCCMCNYRSQSAM